LNLECWLRPKGRAVISVLFAVDTLFDQRVEERQAHMNTKNIKDKAERKKLKRAARNKRAPKAKRTEPRGSRKPKLKKRGPGTPARR